MTKSARPPIPLLRFLVVASVSATVMIGLQFPEFRWLGLPAQWPFAIITIPPVAIGAGIGLRLRTRRLDLSKTRRDLAALLGMSTGIVAGANFASFVWPGAA